MSARRNSGAMASSTSTAPLLITQPREGHAAPMRRSWTKSQLLSGQHKATRGEQPTAAAAAPPPLVSRQRSKSHKHLLSILHPKASQTHNKRAAAAYAWLLFVATLLCVAQLVASSYDQFQKQNEHLLFVADATLSTIFLIDYLLRLYCAPELPRMRSRGLSPWATRLRWAVTWEALIYAISTFPFFVDLSDGRYGGLLNSGLNTSWVRVFRVFNIFRNNEYHAALNTVMRVLIVNRTILLASVALVFFMILLTATLVFSVADGATLKANSIDSIPDAMYLAVLMLTGQAIPEGTLNPGTKAIVIFTAFLSVPIFAVPAAMLTWGFEGEAARLAAREQRRVERNRVYREGHEGIVVAESSADSDSDYEDYLRGVAGADASDDGREDEAERALDFFAADDEGVGRVVMGGGSLQSGEAGALNRALLPSAQRLASEMKERQERDTRQRHLREDALRLIEASLDVKGLDEKADAAEVEAMEVKLRRFKAAVCSIGRSQPTDTAAAPTEASASDAAIDAPASAPASSAAAATASRLPSVAETAPAQGGGAQGGGSAVVDGSSSSDASSGSAVARLERLETEVAALRQLVTSGMSAMRTEQAEIKALIASLAR